MGRDDPDTGERKRRSVIRPFLFPGQISCRQLLGWRWSLNRHVLPVGVRPSGLPVRDPVASLRFALRWPRSDGSPRTKGEGRRDPRRRCALRDTPHARASRRKQQATNPGPILDLYSIRCALEPTLFEHELSFLLTKSLLWLHCATTARRGFVRFGLSDALCIQRGAGPGVTRQESP